MLLSLSALALVACGGSENTATSTAQPASGANSEYLIKNDHVTGSPDAAVTLVE